MQKNYTVISPVINYKSTELHAANLLKNMHVDKKYMYFIIVDLQPESMNSMAIETKKKQSELESRKLALKGPLEHNPYFI